MVYLVRHAHAGSKKAWRGPDELRPLSGSGRLEALGLLERLAPYPVERILSSPTHRCRQTVEPLARQRGLEVEATGVLAVEAQPDGLLGLVTDPAMARAVLCTHGELIGRVLGRLAGDGLELGAEPRWAKGSTWVLHRGGGRLTSARYLEPLSR